MSRADREYTSEIAGAFAALLDAAETVEPVPRKDETIGEIITRAPKDHDVHRLMARFWTCRYCQRRGTFHDLLLCIKGDGDTKCPRCSCEDGIVLLDDAGAVA